MRKHHPNNERVKREYLTYLEQAKHMSTSTVDQVAASIALFEESTGWKDFKKFTATRPSPSSRAFRKP